MINSFKIYFIFSIILFILLFIPNAFAVGPYSDNGNETITVQGFDYLVYLAANPDLPSGWGKAECMNHYRLYGFAENRAVAFALEEYLNANPDLPANWTLAEALNHYNMYGKFENRLLAFDAQEYLSLYADLPQNWSYAQAYAHYVNYGSNEGRIASFDETAYLELYEDLPTQWDQVETFNHYLNYGQSEGRAFDPYDEEVFLAGGESDTVCNSGTPVLDNQPPLAEDYTEEVGGVSIDMVYMPGGTFTLGCEGVGCPADTDPMPGVTVSSYHIAKNQVTAAMWEAVMGESLGGMVSITWYDAMRFACELSHQTGRAYRMMTEAEFEYAAKNYLSRLEDIGENSMTGEEWAYNSWELSHMGGTDPVGNNSGKHTQKTRRDIQGSLDNITGRLIRSIDGIGPQLRLVVSNEMDFPPDYVPPCELCPPVPPEEPDNSYRDSRWITGSDAHWKEGSIKIGDFDLRAWEDGTAILNGASGQWFTSNNIAFVFVPSSGSILKYAYIWLDETQGTLISDAGFSDGYIGRIEKVSASGNKPTISGLQSGADLAAEAGDDYKMVDMENIPESAKEQDQRLIDGPGQGWFQDNSSVGGSHHYRKDVDADEFRFTVNQGQMTMLANGDWFTVNNTFLRITHSSGYTTDYLYALSSDGYFHHNSYQAYERADFRMFQKKSNNEGFPSSCGSHCNQEIPKGEDASIYFIIGGGESTYVPAPCPADGCDYTPAKAIFFTDESTPMAYN